MLTPDHVEDAMSRGLAWLADVQEGDGDIPVFACRRRDLSGRRHLDSSPFNAAHILEGVRACGGPEAGAIAAGLEAYLWREASPGGTWSYFARKTGRKIDDDLDDTSCCAALLRGGERDRDLASNRELILANRDEHGRFKTWLRPPEARNDVDSVVNANVLWYLGDHEGTRAAAAWLCELVRSGAEAPTVLYYENRLTLYFALARALAGGASGLAPVRAPILDRLERVELGALDAVELAFCCRAAQDLDGPAELRARLLEALLGRQAADGSFPAAPVWNGPEHPAPRSVWWAGEPLTIGLALGCLAAARGR
ncbi:hypothetical protein ENSA5_23390 [Enhygromyxa salina]|uniref:Prenyltransferase and squalene oxidase repeat protein n=2 Tax=Enhygromyxa salina TaxID=215803 RepID=A0A2S9YBH9_9BACT|nr:hypothetical protein ENSA5_23390 [Enhygromyxa salina]